MNEYTSDIYYRLYIVDAVIYSTNVFKLIVSFRDKRDHDKHSPTGPGGP